MRLVGRIGLLGRLQPYQIRRRMLSLTMTTRMAPVYDQSVIGSSAQPQGGPYERTGGNYHGTSMLGRIIGKKCESFLLVHCALSIKRQALRDYLCELEGLVQWHDDSRKYLADGAAKKAKVVIAPLPDTNLATASKALNEVLKDWKTRQSNTLSKVGIINMSWVTQMPLRADYRPSSDVREHLDQMQAVLRKCVKNGLLPIAAAGNGGLLVHDVAGYPARFASNHDYKKGRANGKKPRLETLLVVGATNNEGQIGAEVSPSGLRQQVNILYSFGDVVVLCTDYNRRKDGPTVRLGASLGLQANFYYSQRRAVKRNATLEVRPVSNSRLHLLACGEHLRPLKADISTSSNCNRISDSSIHRQPRILPQRAEMGRLQKASTTSRGTLPLAPDRRRVCIQTRRRTRVPPSRMERRRPSRPRRMQEDRSPKLQ